MYGYYREKLHVNHLWELKGYYIETMTLGMLLFFLEHRITLDANLAPS